MTKHYELKVESEKTNFPERLKEAILKMEKALEKEEKYKSKP